MDPSKAISRLLKRPNSSKNDSTSRKSSKRISSFRQKERHLPFRQKASISADEVQIIDDEEMKKCSLNRSTSSEAISSFLSRRNWKCLPCKLGFDTWEGLRQHMSAYHPSSQQKAIESSVETGQEDEDKIIDQQKAIESSVETGQEDEDKIIDQQKAIESSVETGQEDEDKIIDDEETKKCSLKRSNSSQAISSSPKRSKSSRAIFSDPSKLPRPCKNCKWVFRSEKLFHQHLRYCLKQKASKSSVETGQEDEDKKIEDEEKKKRGSWNCGVCYLEFQSQEVFDQHRQKHKDLFKPKASKLSPDDEEMIKKWISFKCPFCELVLQTPDDFSEHERESHPSHWRQRSQPCVSSAAPTWQEYDAEYKEYQEKGWESWMCCQYCNVSFPGSKALDRHISSDHPSLLANTGQNDEKEIGDVDVDQGEKENWLINKTALITLRAYAQAALQHYNNQNLGKRYALVAHGYTNSTGKMNHLNFEAKEEDCPGALVETFFAQLTLCPWRVDCCVSLGPSRDLPPLHKEMDLRGCRFCRPIIHHPRERVANLILDPFSG